MVTAVDDGVGRILAKLDELGIDDNTMVIFLSDNGGARGKGSNNGELRGFKGGYFEGGVHVPFAVRWPGKVPAGQVYQNPVSSLDILGTFAGITQAPIGKERPLDGVNLMPFITGKDKGIPHDVLFWRSFDQGTLATRRGDSKAISSARDGEFVFDLGSDLSEENNLIKDNKEQYQQHVLEMKAWETELIDPIFRPLQGRHVGNVKVKNKNKNKK